jgi:hypothetical protein
MPTKKKPSPAQLAARAKFVAMVRAKSKAKKSATKKISGTKKKTTKLPSLFDKPNSRQTGTSNKVKDEKRKALAPGKRKSATGKSYTERRANRSDKPGSLTGTFNIDRLKQAIKIKEGLENNLKIFRTVTPKNRSDYHKLMIKALPQLIAAEKRIISELKKNIK